MKFYITGGTGFIGSRLCQMLVEDGHHIKAASRNPGKHSGSGNEKLQFVPVQDDPSDHLSETDVVINLAGENIFGKRWTKSVKKRIYESRIRTTSALVSGMEKADKKPHLFISASGVDYYNDQGDDVITEDSESGDGFLADVCREWEAESARAADFGVRVVNPRFGVVLGKGGGALATMLPVFKSFIGGSLGSGKQFFPWVHISDLCRSLLFVVKNEEISGPVNITAPEPVTMDTFTSVLGEVLSRPSVFRVPGFALQAAFGEAAEMLTASHRVVPEKLQKHGFDFDFSTLKPALVDLLLKN
ncbi:TIGR01777 family oxidoreductase [Natronogracilivirga saccharolytica]|uniref:TIGR01777 family oxidoreductase n=1 Tax=Natronogracilivirga saccharolytica TaxID=2812953 RepID=A0A8J7RPH3_9BACT|nr:TIGR01777 family oxidoreductase [Natronogracilivirga saccharolytica]MBP3191474.1 TIGR01777 family oxidoreductase [Natronogracilivirga saccharolytica]